MSSKSSKQRTSSAEPSANLIDLNVDELIANGLSSDQAAERVELGLTNAQNNDSSRSFASILRANLFTLFNSVVGICFFTLLILGQWKDALFGTIVILNILIGVVQEYRSKRALDRLAVMNAPLARVRRDGHSLELPVSEVVLDDLLELRAGDQVVADAVVLNCQNLELDESLLTGESDAVEKVELSEVMAGSGVAAGKGLARVIRVGSETYASKLTLEARRFSLVNSELRNALNQIVKWITWLLLPVIAIVMNGQMMAHGGWTQAIASGAWVAGIVGAIAAVISMIPQGLVLLTSIAFAVAAVKLARNQVLVQELAAVEGLARVDVICFDKTGTLTEGEIEFDENVLIDSSGSKLDWQSVLAHFASAPDANATSRSLAGNFAQVNLAAAREIEFSSARKFSAFEFNAGGKAETWVLGAPEMVLLEKSHQPARKQATTIAETGKRTLVLARTTAHIDGQHLPTGLEPVALVLFKEKIRSDATETLNYFKSQGVSVRIISGDNPATVAAVAKAAGLEGTFTGFDARNLPTDIDELSEVMRANFVFGRVTPEQKRDMVLALQKLGHVVAMTGDGVNDALALKKADLGIAMGSGSSATKAVANLVLLDGKFSSLPGVVAEGRKVIANVERVSALFLNKTVWAILLGLTFGFALWPFPYLPRQLSIIDAFTIGIPAFALALLPNTRRYVPGFLRRTLGFSLRTGIAVVSALIALRLLTKDWSVIDSQTATSTLLSITGLWVLISLARPLNRIKLAIVALMAGIGVASFTIAVVADFYSFSSLSPSQLLIPIALALAACTVIEIARVIINRRTSEEANI
jgi:cation-transporting ATPase E